VASWIIDTDHIAEPDAKPGTNSNAVGVMGPHGTTYGPDAPELKHRFRMYDDDGELYYSGRCTEPDTFDPLDDYGTPNAGCTSIQFQDPTTGEWRTL